MSKTSRILAILLIIVICLIWLIFALNGYPLLNGDTVCFLPTAIELKNGYGLVNHLYHPISLAENRFLFYPPFFPWVMSLIIPSTSEISIYVGLYIIQVVSFLIAIAVLYKLYERVKLQFLLSPVWETLFVMLTVLATSACFSAGYSRPEGLCKLLLTAGIYIALSKFRYELLLIGLLNTASLLTSPIFGIYMVLLSAVYIIISKQFNFKAIMTIGFSMVASLLLSYLAYPYKAGEFLHGVALHSHNAVFNNNLPSFTLQNIISYHITSIDTPLGIFLVISAISIGASIIVQKSELTWSTKFLALLIVLLLVVTVKYFSFKTIFMSYYMYVLTPLMLVLVVHGALMNKKVMVVASLLFLAICAPPLRLLLIFINNGTYGTNYNIRHAHLQLLNKYPNLDTSEVGYTASFWPIFINNSKANLVRFHASPIDTKNGRYQYLVIQQVASNFAFAPAIPGYRLVENNFSEQPVMLFGKRIANQPLAYQYAFYEKN